jgi:hypothetical protein
VKLKKQLEWEDFAENVELSKANGVRNVNIGCIF